MDKNYEGNSGFEQGTPVVIESAEGTFMGEIIAISSFGVHLLETHRMEEVGGASEEDVHEWLDMFKEASQFRLRKYAVTDLGINPLKVLGMSRMALVEICVNDMIDAKNTGIRKEMITLSRPVETLIKTKEYQMRYTTDYGIEASLRPLDFHEDVGED